MGCGARRGVAHHRTGTRSLHAAARRCGRPWLPMAGRAEHPGRCRLGQRLLPGHADRDGRGRGTRHRSRRLRRASARADGCATAGARHEHLERLQQLGRSIAVHRGDTGVVPAPLRARDAVPTRDRSRRPQGAAGPLGRGSRPRRADLPGVPQRPRLPGDDRLVGLVHLRAPIRRVGRARGVRVRLRGLVGSRPRARRARRLRPDRVGRSRRVLVRAPAFRGRNPRRRRRPARELLREHDVLAGPHRGGR